MKKKLKVLMGEAADQVKVSTFHSFAHEIITENHTPGFKNNTTILTSAQRFMILEKLLSNPKTAGTFYVIKPASAKKLHSLHSIFGLFKKECITNENIISYTNQCLESILPYEEEYSIIHIKTMEKQVSDNIWHDKKERELNILGFKLPLEFIMSGSKVVYVKISGKKLSIDEALKSINNITKKQNISGKPCDDENVNQIEKDFGGSSNSTKQKNCQQIKN